MAYPMWIAECRCPDPGPRFMSQERAWLHEDSCAITRTTVVHGRQT